MDSSGDMGTGFWPGPSRNCLTSPPRARSHPEPQSLSLLPVAADSLEMVASCLLF